MAFNGYLLKIGDYKLETDRFVKADSYKPYVNMQDIDDWTDSKGYLHRNAVELKAMKVEFDTPAMLTNTSFNEFMSNIRRNYLNATAREVMVEAYIPELDDYVTQRCYMADIQPQIYRQKGNVLEYDAIHFSFVGGLADD